jgi:putative SOS response-associated peptidase YedK
MIESLSMIADSDELVRQFSIDRILAYNTNRYELKPTESISAIYTTKQGERILDEFRWGLMPFWAKSAVCGDRDAVFMNEAFERIVRKQRCFIPVNAFYVSQKEGKETKWIRIKMRSGTFGIAGLYDVWQAPYDGVELRTCMLLMTEANPLVAPFRSLMPAILEGSAAAQWLQPEQQDPRLLYSLLRPVDELLMAANMLSSPEEKYETRSDVGFVI